MSANRGQGNVGKENRPKPHAHARGNSVAGSLIACSSVAVLSPASRPAQGGGTRSASLLLLTVIERGSASGA